MRASKTLARSEESMSSRARPSLPWKLELWSRSAAALSMLVGLTVLIGGWALGVETIKGVGYSGALTLEPAAGDVRVVRAQQIVAARPALPLF